MPICYCNLLVPDPFTDFYLFQDLDSPELMIVYDFEVFLHEGGGGFPKCDCTNNQGEEQNLWRFQVQILVKIYYKIKSHLAYF